MIASIYHDNTPYTLFSLWSGGDSKLRCGGNASVRSVVLTNRWPFFPVDEYSVWLLLAFVSVSLFSLSLLWAPLDAATCVVVGGGGACCERGSGCGGEEELAWGGFLFELWSVFSNVLCRLEMSMFSCANGGGGGWGCFFPGLQRRTGKNCSSEQRSEIFEMGTTIHNIIWITVEIPNKGIPDVLYFKLSQNITQTRNYRTRSKRAGVVNIRGH